MVVFLLWKVRQPTYYTIPWSRSLGKVGHLWTAFDELPEFHL